MENKTLYCYKFDEKTGDIAVDEITNYRIVNLSQYVPRFVIKFVKNGTGYSVKEANLNKLVNWKVYSFDSNLQNAKNIIKRDVKKKVDKANFDYFKWCEIYNKIQS